MFCFLKKKNLDFWLLLEKKKKSGKSTTMGPHGLHGSHWLEERTGCPL